VQQSAVQRAVEGSERPVGTAGTGDGIPVIERLEDYLPPRVLSRVPRALDGQVVALPSPEPGGMSPRGVQLALTDGLAIAGLTLGAGLAYRRFSDGSLQPRLATAAVVVVAFLVALALAGSYGRGASGLITRPVNGSSLLHGLPLGVLLAMFATRAPAPLDVEDFQLGEATLVGVLCLLAIPATRMVVWSLVRPRRLRRVIIVGTGRVAATVAARLHRSSRVRVLGMVDDDPSGPARVLGTQADLPELCARYQVDDVVVAFSRTPTHETLDFLRRVGDQVSVWVVPRLYELLSWRSEVGELQGIPLLGVAPAQAARAARAAKRAFDVVVAGLLLLLFAPVFAITALAIRLTSPGPVLFRQLRTGQHGRPFRIYKFRTMCVDAEEQRTALTEHNEVDGPIFKMRQDPRVTRVGHWLRQTSLDELPQLLNVLRGEMSLVGPRPFPVEESAKIDGWAAARFSVPPGMTGLWQVCGRNALSYDDLRHLDYVYATSWSLLWDLRILLQTPVSVLDRRGVL
jgi:exopolysaccharide biosynthesis polyprenyl glycosylphosphotransferase